MQILLDLGKLTSKVKPKKKQKKKQKTKANLTLKGIKSQLKGFKGTDVSCLLRLGLLLLINRASEIFHLNLLCLYPELRKVKWLRVTKAWFEFTECRCICEFLSLPLWSSIRSTNLLPVSRGGSRAAATSKIERFVIIVNGFQPLTIITKRSILDVAAALDTLLLKTFLFQCNDGEDSSRRLMARRLEFYLSH